MRSQKARVNHQSSPPRKPRQLGYRKRCEVQKKVRYATKLDALTALATVSKVHAETAQRPYRCPHCGDWHLSSRGK